MTPDLKKQVEEKFKIKFKQNAKPKSQKAPKLSSVNKQPKIQGLLAGKKITLDTEKAERINILYPERYTLSQDGTSVKDKVSGDDIPLRLFHLQDEEDLLGVTFALDEDGIIEYVRVKGGANLGHDKSKNQNFERLPGPTN